ncbi:leucine-rich repeat domain-containing protein [Streptomyces asoensis]|uniref:Leucine-rich repeat domain-containing protein n=1 Tax=Streptomyces asoensis TaxID=249586 RepID=A0A6M4X2D0_9ACTN|nr:STM4015 family protein [Streptomyces asoensis]QJT05981.1 leucine-rich repeat domain-containing protein [Streptomyces asoensis]
MTISHISELHGLPVYDFPLPGVDAAALPAEETVAWKIFRHENEPEDFDECWNRFLDTVDPSRVRALVLGAGAYGSEHDAGDGPEEVAERLAGAADRLTGLRALYLADLEFEECELSWIVQGDVSPFLAAYPGLEELAVRGSGGGFGGGPGLEFTPLRHESLRILRFENGGLPAEVVHGVAASELPALEHLDLWLGAEWYGRTTTVADLAPILDGSRLPALRRLGLQNGDNQDEVAAAVAAAPVVARLTALHLGRGTLSDTGAAALLSGQPLVHLQELDLHHHYLSEAMAERIRQALEPYGVKVDVSGREDADGPDDRYVAAGE